MPRFFVGTVRMRRYNQTRGTEKRQVCTCKEKCDYTENLTFSQFILVKIGLEEEVLVNSEIYLRQPY